MGVSHPRLTGERQRGMALLVVLLILSVMVVVASSMSSRLQVELRRTANLTAHRQAWWYALSAEELVKKVLAQDIKDSPERIHLGQNWARKEVTFTLDEGQLQGNVLDLQSCFNLNSLSVANKEGSGELLAYSVQVFRHLLEQLLVDDYEAAQVTDAIRDWVDSDTVLISSLGAEDAYYEGVVPPYLPANQWMLGRDELRAVRGITPELYGTLAPYVCALPTDKLQININTLNPDQPELLTALYLGKLPLDDAKRILTERPQKGWEEVKLMTNQLLPIDTIPGLKESLVINSHFFAAKVVATVGDRQARLYSFLQRGDKGQLVVVYRLSDEM